MPSKSHAGVLASAAVIKGPLFCHFSGKPLTRHQLSAVLAKVLTKSSIDSKNFESHSFRIEAATTLALQGKTQQVIQSAGIRQSIMHIVLIFVNAKIYLAKSHIIHTLLVVASG